LNNLLSLNNECEVMNDVQNNIRREYTRL
jgi:hypothetical protein